MAAEPWRYVEPQAGLMAWIHGFSLPYRLQRYAQGRKYEIIGIRDVHAAVMIGAYEKLVQARYLDCGREWRLASGDWVPESDERVRRWLLKAITDVRAGGVRIVGATESAKWREYIASDLEWVLRRNGWRR